MDAVQPAPAPSQEAPDSPGTVRRLRQRAALMILAGVGLIAVVTVLAILADFFLWYVGLLGVALVVFGIIGLVRPLKVFTGTKKPLKLSAGQAADFLDVW